MNLGQNVTQGLKQATEAATTDAVKGVGEVAKTTAKQTVETLSGGVVKMGGDEGSVKTAEGLTAVEQQGKQQKKVKDRRRLQQVQEDIRMAARRQKEQAEMRKQQQAREQQEKRVMAEQEKSRKKNQLARILGRISGMFGGSGEIRGGVN